MGIRKDFSWMLLSRGASMACGLGTAMLINRALAPEARGLLSEMQTWVGLYVVLFGISLESAIYHVSNRKRYSESDADKCITILTMSCAFITFGATAIWLSAMLRPNTYSPEAQHSLGTLALLLGLTMLATNLGVILQALGEVIVSAQVGLAQAATYTAIVLACFFAGILRLETALNLLLVFQACGLLLLLCVAWRRGLFYGRFSRPLALTVLKAGGKLHLATICTFVYMKLNLLILFKFSGETQTGLYAVAQNLAFSALIIPQTFQSVLFPRIIHGDDELSVTIRSMRLMLYSWGAVSLLCVILASPLIRLYAGSRYLDSVNVFRLLTLATYLIAVSSTIGPYYIKKGAFALASASSVLICLISLALNFGLVRMYGAIGAALATALSMGVGLVLTLLFLRYLSGCNPLVIFRPDLREEIRALFRRNTMNSSQTDQPLQ